MCQTVNIVTRSQITPPTYTSCSMHTNVYPSQRLYILFIFIFPDVSLLIYDVLSVGLYKATED